MTREEAAKILDPETREEVLCEYEYYGGFHGREAVISAVDEACVVAVEALLAQQELAKLDRRRWKGCEHCKGDLEGYTVCFQDVNGQSRSIYIPEGEAAIVVPGKYNHKFWIPIKYCPFCGRPLTEEAWAELEQRIRLV